MKNLVKKHMIGLFALVLTVATMSFKMAEKSNSSDYWFSVDGSGQVTGYIGPTLSGDCSTTNEDHICAQSYTEAQTLPGPGGTRILNTAETNWQEQAFRPD
jgi:hypothetical protein